jgi:uncharacterized protein (TIGR02145 family)
MMIKDVDSVRNKIVGWSIKDAETGKDKTCLYHFYPIDSCIVIVPATLTLFTGSATKEYDGKPLTNGNWNVQGLQNGEHVWCMPSASLTDVGSIENSCEINWDNPGPWGENIAQQKNYTVINHFGTLSVTPNTQPITLTAKSASKKYDGTALTNDTVVATGLLNGFYVEATTSGSQTDVGTSANEVSSYVIKNANGEDKTEYFTNITLVPGTLTVNPTQLTVITGSAEKEYDGTPLTSNSVCIRHGIDTIYPNSNGQFSILNSQFSIQTTGSQTEVGESANTYTIDWGTTNPNNYEISDNLGVLKVTPASVMVVADNTGKTYGSADPELTATVYGIVVGDAITYTLSREAGEDAGTYVITPTGDADQGNYTVTYEPGTFTINRATATVTADDKEKVEHATDPELIATVSGLQNNDAASVINYTLNREAGEAVGTYAITPSGDAVQGNYDVTYVPGTLTITSSTDVVVRIVGHNNTTAYDGGEHSVNGYDVVSISNSGYTEGDIIFNGTAQVERTIAGTTYMGLDAEQFINNNGNFDVTFIVTDGYQTITPAPATVVADNKSKTYGETDPVLSATVTGTISGETLNYTLSRAAGNSAGTYPIIVSLGENPNYQVTATNGVFTINRAALTVKADDKEKTFGADDPVLTATVSGLQNGDAANVVTYTLSRVAGENVGTYTITPSGNAVQGNYNVTYLPGTLTISSSDDAVEVKIAGHRNTAVYNGVEHTTTGYDVVSVSNPSYTENDFTFSGTASAARTDVGTTPMGLNANQFSNTNTNFPHVNFIVTVDGCQTITKAPATVTADDSSKTYGDTDPMLTATITGTVEGDTIDYTLSRTAGDTVGTYEITVTLGDNPNYEVTTSNGILTINKKAATVAADSLSKVYGDTDPTLTATVSGTVDGDVIDFTLSRAAGEIAGTYPITVTLGSNPNYDVTPTNGIFTIAQKLVTIVVDNKSKTYGDTDPEFTATVDGVLDGDTIQYTLDRDEGENAGTYPITVTLGNNQNYFVMVTNGIFTITPATLTVKADNKTKVYGTADPVLTALVSGLRNGDAASAINYSLSRDAGENVAEYTIMVTPGTNPNYTVNTQNGVFSITKKPATVVANNKSKTYGNTDPTLTATVTGAVGNDVLNYTLARESGENVGLYPITVTLNNNPNYEVTTSPGSFTITPATAMVMADDKEKVRVAPDPSLTATVTGLKNGDSESLISYSISREPGDTVGTYAITPSGAAKQGNYNITYLPGVLTIVDDTIIVVGTLETVTVNGCTAGDAPAPYTTIEELEAAGLTIQGDCQEGFFHVSSNEESIGSTCVTVTRTYTISDDCGDNATAIQLIYITHNEGPHEVGVPVPTSSEILCYSDALIPPHENLGITMPMVEDSCSNELSFSDPTLSNNYNSSTCSGDITYDYTYTDCAGKMFQWHYTYHILPPTITFTAPDDIAVCRNTDGSYTITPEVTGTVQDVVVSCSTVDTTYLDADPVENQDGSLTIVRTWTITNTCQNAVSKEQSITVLPLPTIHIEPVSQTITYGDTIEDVVISNTHSNVVVNSLPAGLTYNSATQTISGTPSAAGNYSITVEAVSDQTPGCGTAEQEVTIVVGKRNATITALNQSYVFNGQPKGEDNATYIDPAVIVTKINVTGLQGNDQLTSITLDGQETQLGIYPNKIVPSDAAIGSATDNYEITYIKGTLVIGNEALEVTITGNTATMTYNGTEQSVTGYTISIPEGSSLTENDIVGPVAAAYGTNVKSVDEGKYMMGLTANQFYAETSDYAVTFVVTDGWLKITKKSITLALDSSKVYDGTVFDVPASQLHVTGLLENQTLVGHIWTEDAAPGVYESHDGSSQATLEAGVIYNSLSVIDSTSSNVTSSYAPAFDVTLVIEEKPVPPCLGVDYHGHYYDAVSVGSQCWLTENLRCEVGNFHAYKEDSANVEKFGYLYSWYTAMGVPENDNNTVPETFIGDDGEPYVQGICPDGWAVANEADFALLYATAGNTNVLNDPSTLYWLSGSEGMVPNTGFNARANGHFNSLSQRYEDQLTGSYFWMSGTTTATFNSAVIQYYCNEGLFRDHPKTDLQGVRCIRKVAQ